MKAKIEALSPRQFIVQFETPEVGDRQKFLDSLADLESALLSAGYSPLSAVSPPPVSHNGHGAELPCFLVDGITATVADGKASWRVKGGEFQKWGVVIYPEVLERAGLGELNPLKVFNESGLVAYYSVKDDGKPKKVIRLERVG